jgi:hypothetical protein
VRYFLVFSLVLGLASSAFAADNETSRFLGPESDWQYARLELYDPPMLDAGCSIAVAGSGSASLRFLEGANERRFALVIAKEDALALVKLAQESDLAGLKIPDHAGIPDEHRMMLELENVLGEKRRVSRWGSDKVPAFSKVEDALRALEKKCEGKEPVYQGKVDGSFRPFAGIQVTVSLSMNRPDPSFELVRPEDWEKVRSLLQDLTPTERPVQKEAPGKYRGFLLAPRELPALPKWISAQKSVVQVGDSPRDVTYKKDDRGLEAWLLLEAKKRGIEIPK